MCFYVSSVLMGNIMKELLIGKRIKLCRPIYNSEMATTIFNIIDKCKETFTPWLGWAANYSNKAAADFLKVVDEDWNNNTQFVYAIYLENTFIGVISILNVAWQHKRAEIGYWLDTDYTGNGYMTEAVRLIEKELFDNDFNRIVIHTDVLNVKSAKIPQTLGYKLEGILRQDIYSEPNQRFRDRNVFSKLKSDYNIKK